MNELNNSRPGYYFSLLRFLAMLRGGDARRVENNGVEACVAGVAIYLISYLFFARFIPALEAWQRAVLFVLLLFLVCLFWLMVLYINSLVIQFARFCGLLQTIPIRRAQSVLLGIWTSLMASDLLRHGSWKAEIGAVWLITVAMNLAAGAVLALRNGTDRAD
jgi:hypothetical protein